MKKIALLIGGIDSNIQSVLVEQLYRKSLEYDYRIHAFVVYGIYGLNVLHSYSEMGSLLIPNLEDYDAVLVDPTSFVQENYETFRESVLLKLSCPVISIRSNDPEFYSVVNDDYMTMRKMVEHFTDYHHFKKICFVSGPRNREDANERLRAFREVMNEHRYPVTDDMICYGNFWKNLGNADVEHFKITKDNYPEAIICANDYMATGVVMELQKRGFRIPEDICVSGYDDVEESLMLSPPLSTVHVDITRLGQITIELLHDILEGKNAPKKILHSSSPVFRNSCGCPFSLDSGYIRKLVEQVNVTYVTMENITNQSTDFANISTYEDLVRSTIPYVSDCRLSKIYVCFCDETEKNREQAAMNSKFTENMHLKTILYTDHYEAMDEIFPRSEILPAKYLDQIAFPIVTSMFNHDNSLGYFVADCGDISHIPQMQFIFRTLVQQFSATVNRVKIFAENQILSRVWEINNRDELTGILNRRGIENFIQQSLLLPQNKPVDFCIVSSDMDGLKYINDNFGHQEGDVAIIAFASILSGSVHGLGEVARIGGDEFMLCLNTSDSKVVDNLIHSIRTQIEEYNQSGNKGYDIGASFGYDFYSPEKRLGEVIKTADSRMYAEKATHKNNRL